MTMTGTKILLIEDDVQVRQMTSLALKRAGFESLEASDADEGLPLIQQHDPDLILLDWMLPGLSGADLTRRLRADAFTQAIPIIMLTARSDEDDRIKGLEAGADDYVTKPFSPRELVARVKSVLRRVRPELAEDRVGIGELELDPTAHRVMVGKAPVSMGPTEFRLLHFFLTHPARVYSRGQLLDQLWGRNVYVEERTVDVHILRLRRALMPYGYSPCIQTVRGLGYRFSPEHAPEAQGLSVSADRPL